MIYRILPLLVKLSRPKKQIIQIFCDILFILFSITYAIYLQNKSIALILELNTWLVLIPAIILNLVTFYIFGLYHAVVRHISTETIKNVGVGVFTSSLFLFLLCQLLNEALTFEIIFLYALLLFSTSLGARFYIRQMHLNKPNKHKKTVAIYGAGDVGRQVLNSISKSSEYIPIMFIDDATDLIGRKIANLSIYSMREAEKIFKKDKIDVLLVAMPNIPLNIQKNILKQLQKYPIQIKVMPSLKSLIEGSIEVNEMRTISIDELLGRNAVKPNSTLIKKNIQGKNILVTGAGGSIGSELCRQIIKCDPKRLILLDISEASLFTIQQEILKKLSIHDHIIEIVPTLCSIDNATQIFKILNKFKVQTIFHAAAYKHVPLVESNIIAAINNNIFGTKTLGEMAIKAKVKKFILISSDKAIRPTNFMGATKRYSELICQDLALSNITDFSMVRFGNVLGSSGSVIPKFQEQINNGGPVTVTHKEITRFFMTIPEAAQLVLQTSSMSKGKHIFILDMGSPIKIIDLAFKMIHLKGLKPYVDGSNEPIDGGIPILITGLRPGEKLYEELLLGKNSIKTIHPKIYMEILEGVETKELKILTQTLLNACNANDISTIKNIFSHPAINLTHSGKIIDLTI